MFDELTAFTADGVTLRIDRARATGERRGAVLCLHAMMTDGRYFGARKDGSFAAALAAAGLDVLVADFRGHGRSCPPRAGKDDWSFDDLVELDLPALVGAAAAASACGPEELVILGHSLGGLVATAAIGSGRIAPPRLLVLPATGVWLAPRSLRRRAVMALYRGSAQLLGHAPIRAVRAGTADEPRTYVRQLSGWTRSARWTSLRGADYTRAAEAITTPVFPFTGSGDWMCTPADARAFAGHLAGADEVRVIGGADHFSLFTNPALAPLWRDIAARCGY